MAHGEIKRLGVFAKLSNRSRAVESLKTSLREDSMMKKRDVRIPAKDLGIGFNQGIV
jgi:hypothetical protein